MHSVTELLHPAHRRYLLLPGKERAAESKQHMPVSKLGTRLKMINLDAKGAASQSELLNVDSTRLKGSMHALWFLPLLELIDCASLCSS